MQIKLELQDGTSVRELLQAAAQSVSLLPLPPTCLQQAVWKENNSVKSL